MKRSSPRSVPTTGALIATKTSPSAAAPIAARDHSATHAARRAAW